MSVANRITDSHARKRFISEMDQKWQRKYETRLRQDPYSAEDLEYIET